MATIRTTSLAVNVVMMRGPSTLLRIKRIIKDTSGTCGPTSESDVGGETSLTQ